MYMFVMGIDFVSFYEQLNTTKTMTYGLEQKCVGVKPFNGIPPSSPSDNCMSNNNTIKKNYSTGIYLEFFFYEN